ncbi:MAG TPA: hypothetical protein VNO35_17570, partial [Steroidobacteraceae bacterium]|nr:hypothetical protein [Steroidobacteraceae bacterium]
AQISAMVIGGVASSFLGRPRMTQDVDALAILPENKWDAATEAARRLTSYTLSSAASSAGIAAFLRCQLTVR